MLCTVCEEELSTENFAVANGLYYCLTCFIDNYRRLRSKQKYLRRRFHVDDSEITVKQSDSSVEPCHFYCSRETERNVTPIEDKYPVDTTRLRPETNTTYANLFQIDQRRRTSQTLSTDYYLSCQVCFEEKSVEEFNTIPDHRCHATERTICNDCLYSHVLGAFQGVFTSEVHCPELSCGTILTFETIKYILISKNNKELFQRYDKYVCCNLLEQMDEFIWCANPKCAMGQLNDGGSRQNIVTCLRCKHKTCFIHKVPWHTNMSCDEYETKMDPNAQASLKWITQNTKQCPKCSYRIEKNDGCDHMTCTKCHHEFCWACLADFNVIRQDGNHRHDPSCKHYAAYDKA